MSMKSTIANDREIFDTLVRHEAVRKLRASFDAKLGHPIWWFSYKINIRSYRLQQSIESSYEIWNDPRVKNFRFGKKIFKALKKRLQQTQPYQFEEPRGVRSFCVPLLVEQRAIGYFVLTGIRKNPPQETLNLLASFVQILVENSAKTEELARLSATIRPRAIALSTVHTVHRIINSTLNLDELVSRLAHLTAQVLRVHRCAIYLVDKTQAPATMPLPTRKRTQRGALLRKALIGYPKKHEKHTRLPFGKGIEGYVAKTARMLLRKKFICIPLIDEDVVGVVHVSFKKDKKDFNYFDLEILTTLAEEAVIAIKNAQLYEEQRRVTLGTIQSLAVILGTRVPSHSIVSPEVFLRLSLKLAHELKMSEEESQALHYATLLKDTTKIGIPDEILKKPTKLTGEEYSLLREHPIKGAKIVQHFESLKPVAPIILYSREKYDGSGYPEGLKGERIPMGARILSVMNAFEAIITGRPYRGQSSLAEALDEISRNSGTQFDPKVVDAFIRITQREGLTKLLKNAKE